MEIKDEERMATIPLIAHELDVARYMIIIKWLLAIIVVLMVIIGIGVYELTSCDFTDVSIDSTDGGMDLEDATKMFDRFVSDGKNKRIGTGLDLPIVKEMIEQMGGTIDVLSEPDKGSSFFIALPCEMIDFERKIVI